MPRWTWAAPQYGGPETLNGVVLQNAGTATLATPSEMALQNGAGIDNQTSGSFTLQDNTTISNDSSATYFNNEGTLIQVAGAHPPRPSTRAFTQSNTGSTAFKRVRWCFRAAARLS